MKRADLEAETCLHMIRDLFDEIDMHAKCAERRRFIAMVTGKPPAPPAEKELRCEEQDRWLLAQWMLVFE